MATKPGILTIDDDVNVLRAVQSDLRKKYGAEYRISSADSGPKALELLTELKKRGDSMALMVVDQRMPSMSGVEFLKEAIQLFPDSKRVLLTAYADTSAAIDAINQVKIDHYLLKPWDPPEEKLYPLLSDLLDDWQSHYRSPFDGIRVVGSHWSPASHLVKDFLARNNIPYKWLDPEISDEARQLMELSETAPDLPCLFFPDGSTLEKPDNRQIADKVGLKTTADMPLYDLAIVGAGPAGLAASVYGASEGLRTIVIEQHAPGGQAGMSSLIENYLGFPKGLSGAELARRASSQATRMGAEILTAQEAVQLDATGPSRTIKLADGTELKCRALLIATGVAYRKLEAPGISELTGAGVYYGAAMTEGETVRGGHVYIVGGANSAGQAAMYFSRFAKSVTMLVRGDGVNATMSQYLIDQIVETDNIGILTRSQVKQATGSERLEKLVLSRDGGEREETVDARAIFIFIGAMPRTNWLKDVIACDDHGFIIAGTDLVDANASAHAGQDRLPFTLETSVPGVFVAGDVRSGGVKRVASAVGEGSMAVMYVHRYLSQT
jgi:thioredoxin reductase (NADPH)